MTHWQPLLGSRAPSVIPGNAGEQERAGLQPPACKPPFLPEMCELWWLMSPGGLVPLLTKSGPPWEVWEFPEDKRLLSVHFPGSLVPRGITSSLLLGMGRCVSLEGRTCLSPRSLESLRLVRRSLAASMRQGFVVWTQSLRLRLRPSQTLDPRNAPTLCPKCFGAPQPSSAHGCGTRTFQVRRGFFC